jgi:hypothetical protein
MPARAVAVNPPSPWRFVIAIGGAFAAWVAQFSIDYILVDYGCSTTHRIVIGAISGIALIAAGAATYVAWTIVSETRRLPVDHGDEAGLTHFGALFGLLTSGLFLGLVILTGAATVVLSPCVH